MNTNKYISLPKAFGNRFIYRIVNLDRLYELFQSRRNTLVVPGKWDDPFENLIGHTRSDANGYQCYGQCWTLQKASDAMWRIYSPDSKAVRIRSTIRKLVESLTHVCTANDLAVIGRVRYLRTSKLIAFMKREHAGKSGNTLAGALAKNLLVKRPAFKHEREVRLLLVRPNRHGAGKDGLLRYSVDPNVLVDQIMIDPRLNKSKANTLKDKIRLKTNFVGPIKRSLLYAPPDI